MVNNGQPGSVSPLETAVRLHQEGHLDQAELIYRRLLASDPGDTEALHLLGVLAHQRGAHAHALDLIGQSLARRPHEARFHANLAEACRAVGDLLRSERHARSAVQLAPSVPNFHNALGLAMQAQGRHAEAEAHFRQALALAPGFALAHSNLGVSLRELGRLADALQAFREAARLQPTLAEARSNLGQLLLERYQVEEALGHCREAVRLRPDSPEALNNLGNVLRALGHLEEARSWYLRVLQIRPDLAMTHNNLGQALQEEGRVDEARACYEQAIRLEPRSARFHCNLASLLHELDRRDESLAHCRHALALHPGHVEAHLLLGELLQTHGDLAGAEASYREALRLDPECPAAHIDLGDALAERGDLQAALACYRQALRHYPREARALACLATALRDRMPEDEQAAAQRLLEGALPLKERTALEYGLAHVRDAQGRAEEAADLLARANARHQGMLQRQGKGYDPAAHARCVDRLIAGFDAGHFARTRGWGLQTEAPVFIVGLPRSGTTLTEQVLASHPCVFGAGELTYTRETFESLPGLLGLAAEPEDCVGRFTVEVVRRAAERHLGRLRELSSADRVVDKMPDNYLWLGLLATLFPRGRFIHCRRDVRATALSCWMTHFKHITWSSDPEHLASRFAEYRRLMKHWRRVLPVPVLEVDYEETVADLEGVARRLVSFCGLEWDPACLRYNQTTRPVRTASVTQVRQPLYRTALARWRPYETALADLFARLPAE